MSRSFSAGPRSSAPSIAASRRWWILAAVGLGNLVSAIDSSITNTVLPIISRDFGASITTIEWVLMAYLLTLSALLLAMGRLGDVAGHRRVFLLGLGIFGVASAICGAAPNEMVLIGFRAVQASGGAMMASTGLVLIGQAFGSSERGKGIGLLMAVTYFGLSTGPALGGLLAGFFSWRAVFYVNVPICLVGIPLGLRTLPGDTRIQTRARFDLLGAAVSILALTSLLIGLSQGQSWGWTSPETSAALAIAVVTGALFVPLELRQPEPMLELRLLLNRLFSSATGSAVLNYAGTFIQLFLLPFYLVQWRGLAVNTAGLLLVVTPVLMMLVSPPAGRISDRIGSRLPSTAGMLLCTIALVGFALLKPSSSVAQIIVTEIVMGLGTGLFTSPNTSTIMGSVSRERQGTAAGMQAVARNVGMVVGIALAGAIFSARLAALGGAGHVIAAFHDTLLVGAGIMFVGAILSSTRGSRAPKGSGGAPMAGMRADSKLGEQERAPM